MGQMRVRRTGPWVKISCPFSWVQFSSRWGPRLGQKKATRPNSNLRKAKVLEIRRFRGLLVRREGFEPPGLLVRRLSQGQIGVISAPICAFCHHSLGGFSVVSVQLCPLFSDSGSKLGQAQSSRIPLTSKVELIYIERGSPGRKLFGLFSYIPKLR